MWSFFTNVEIIHKNKNKIYKNNNKIHKNNKLGNKPGQTPAQLKNHPQKNYENESCKDANFTDFSQNNWIFT